MLCRSLVAGIALSIAACGIGSRAPAFAADIVKVHLPVSGLETMPFLIADDLGFYAKQGIQFERHGMKVDLGVMAVVGGQVDVTQILGLSLQDVERYVR